MITLFLQLQNANFVLKRTVVMSIYIDMLIVISAVLLKGSVTFGHNFFASKECPQRAMSQVGGKQTQYLTQYTTNNECLISTYSLQGPALVGSIVGTWPHAELYNSTMMLSGD